MEIFSISERATLTIALGESHFREFKSALHGPTGSKTPRDRKEIARDIGEALVAFANADGGELLVGVEDNGVVSGIEQLKEDTIAYLQNASETHVHKNTPVTNVRKAIIEIEKHKVLYFSVLKSTTCVHLTSDGRCVQRRDLESVPIPPDEIILNRNERMSREYDRAFVDGASATDLSFQIVNSVADQISPGMSVEKCLQYLELAEYSGQGLALRRAALLLFAKEPSRWHPRLQVRIIKVRGKELKSGTQYNAVSDQIVSGNIVELLVRGWDSLRPQLVQTRLGHDARFGSTVMYPEFACREALTNAIAHRDYSEEGRAIEIYVFDDRMEVRNPGGLLSSIVMDDLLKLRGAHQSRNSMIARTLRELGYMRELGEGIRRMFELMQSSELTPPVIESLGNSFCVTLKHDTIYSTQQQLWLDQFQQHSLTREQKAIVVLGIAGKLISPQEILDNLGIVDTDRYRQLIKSLQELGILRAELPKIEAQREAKKRRISVRKIPRFKISPASPREPAIATEPIVGIDDGPNESASIFITNLAFAADEEQLVGLLSTWAPPENVNIPLDRTSGRKRGFAFAEFETPEIAAEMVSNLDGVEFLGRRLVVRKARPRS
jgi:ATP-dependent DNA helicase RecG